MTEKAYEFIGLSPELYLIRWYRTPNKVEAFEFIQAHQTLLDNAEQSLYFISDLRKGYIRDGEAVRELAKLLEHPRYGGGTAFNGNNTMAAVFVNLFFKLTRVAHLKHNIWRTGLEGLRYLEGIKAGITNGIDVDAVLQEDMNV
jgi:hypothetical protein